MRPVHPHGDVVADGVAEGVGGGAEGGHDGGGEIAVAVFEDGPEDEKARADDRGEGSHRGPPEPRPGQPGPEKEARGGEAGNKDQGVQHRRPLVDNGI